jgi:HSP20 family protein
MAITNWDPFTAAALADSPEGAADRPWKPAVDIHETEAGVVIEAELPGVRQDAVSVEVTANVLTISGQRPRERPADDPGYYRQERPFGPFHRAFILQFDVDPDRIGAWLTDGVLVISIPRPEPRDEPARRIRVRIE